MKKKKQAGGVLAETLEDGTRRYKEMLRVRKAWRLIGDIIADLAEHDIDNPRELTRALAVLDKHFSV